MVKNCKIGTGSALGKLGGVKLAVLVLAAVGIANMWMAVFADVGVAILAILNAMRCMNVKKFQ